MPSPAPAEDERGSERNRWFLILALAALLRAAGMCSQSFHYDEIVCRALSLHSFSELLSGVARDNGNPPLFWVMVRAWSLVSGSGEAQLRALSVLAGTACTALIYRLAREFFDESTAAIAALTYALSPFSLELSTEVRCYAWLQCVAAASFFCFFRFWIQRRSSWLIGVFLCAVLLCFTHYYGFLILLAQLVALLGFRAYRALLAWLGAMAAATGLFAVAWLPVLLAQLRRPGNGTRGGPDWLMQFASTPLVLGVGRSLVWKGSVPLAVLGAVSLIVVLVFWFPAAGFALDRSRDSRLRLALASWLLLPVLVPLAAALLGHPLYTVRYASIGLPAFALSFGAGVAHLRRPRRVAVLAAAALLAAASLAGFYRHPIKEDWRGAMAFLLPELRADDLVLVDTDESVTTFDYYARKAGLTEMAEVGITQTGNPFAGIPWSGGRKLAGFPQDVSAALRSHRRLWLLLDSLSYQDRSDLTALRAAGCSLQRSRRFYRIELHELQCAAGGAALGR
jgi:hypothetical protein